MRKIRFEGSGFRYEDAEVPVPGQGQVRVRTEAVGVGIALVRALRSANGASGGEIVGQVTEVGPGVDGFRVGDRVGGVTLGDAYADEVLVLPTLVSPVPADVPAGAALALVRGGLVASFALRAGRFEAGESVLVTAAASGAGHLAVQLARALGASRVVGAVGSQCSMASSQARSRDKSGFVRGCGADEVVTYDQESWGEPVDIVLDGVGGEQVQRGVDALAPYGRLIAFSAGGGSVDAGSLLGGLKSVNGFSMGLISRLRPDLIDERRAELWDLLADGRVRPVWTDLPFEDLRKAVELVESRRNLGRVALRTV